MSMAAHAAPRPSMFAGLSRARARAGKALAATSRTLFRKITNLRSAALQITGLAGFTTAAWMAHTIAGIAVGSLCLFVLNFLLDDGPSAGGQR